MTLTAFERYAYRKFHHVARDVAGSNARLDTMLQRARITVRAESYLATTFLTVIVAAAVPFAFAVASFAAAVATGWTPLATGVTLVLLVLTLVLPLVVYIVAMTVPETKASARARNIEAHLPYATVYISTLATAGATPQKIFQNLAAQPVYGEVAREAGLIVRDMNVLGMDLVTAFHAATERTPSPKFRTFLQGAITSLTSGVDIKDYFFAQSEQLFQENRQTQRKFVDSLGILAESYITVVVAGTTFFIVLLSIMGGIGSSSDRSFVFGYMLVLVILPLIQVGFGVGILGLTPEE